MTLEHPYFFFLHLYDNYRDNNWVTNRWISVSGSNGLVSGQTDSTSGQCAINVQYAADANGDVLSIYDGKFKEEYKLDTSTLALELDLYQNASNSNDISIQPYNNENEAYLPKDNRIGKSVNIKTMDY